MQLRDLRTDLRSAEELRWFWGESDGDIGERSNFGPTTNRCSVGGRTGGKPIVDIDQRRLDAAGLAREIEHALDACARHRPLLQLVYRDYRFPPLAELAPEVGKGSIKATEEMLAVYVKAFGETVPLAPLVRAAVQAWEYSGTSRPCLAWLVRLTWRVHKGELGRDLLVLRNVQAEAREQLRAALAAFSTARRACRRRRCRTEKGAA